MACESAADALSRNLPPNAPASTASAKLNPISQTREGRLNLTQSEVIAAMVIAGLHEVIAGIALIIAGLFVGYDGPSSMIWGAVMILLGVLLLVFWSVGLP
jgi:hypothetical protein